MYFRKLSLLPGLKDKRSLISKLPAQLLDKASNSTHYGKMLNLLKGFETPFRENETKGATSLKNNVVTKISS